MTLARFCKYTFYIITQLMITPLCAQLNQITTPGQESSKEAIVQECQSLSYQPASYYFQTSNLEQDDSSVKVAPAGPLITFLVQSIASNTKLKQTPPPIFILNNSVAFKNNAFIAPVPPINQFKKIISSILWPSQQLIIDLDLIKNLSLNDLKGVIAHELSHITCSHLMKLTHSTLASLVVKVTALSGNFLYNIFNKGILSATLDSMVKIPLWLFGIDYAKPIHTNNPTQMALVLIKALAVGVQLSCFSAKNSAITFGIASLFFLHDKIISNMRMRGFETEADLSAAKILSDPKMLSDALTKLKTLSKTQNNQTETSWLRKRFKHLYKKILYWVERNHPSIADRVNALNTQAIPLLPNA